MANPLARDENSNINREKRWHGRRLKGVKEHRATSFTRNEQKIHSPFARDPAPFSVLSTGLNEATKATRKNANYASPRLPLFYLASNGRRPSESTLLHKRFTPPLTYRRQIFASVSRKFWWKFPAFTIIEFANSLMEILSVYSYWEAEEGGGGEGWGPSGVVTWICSAFVPPLCMCVVANRINCNINGDGN